MTVRALVTNDDGIESVGLVHLARVAQECGLNVVVAAPAYDASGSSAAVTATQVDGKVVSAPRALPEVDVPAFAVEAAPGFIARIAARGGFGDLPDIVLSGINVGANTGRSVVHSGTVGAALTGAAEGLRAVAVSLRGASPVHWETAVDVMRRVIDMLLELPAPVVLNVNVPDVSLDELRGVRVARLARYGTVQATVAEPGDGYVKVEVVDRPREVEPGTDRALLLEGYATVTALTGVAERSDVDLRALETLEVSRTAGR